MPDDGQVDEFTDPVITQPAFVTAGRAGGILFHWAAGDPRVALIDRGARDGQAEFNGSDDGVSNKRRRIGHRSSGRKMVV